MVFARPTDEELSSKIRELLPRINLETMGMKKFIKLLSSEFDDVDLKPRKDFIKEALTKAINEQEGNIDEEEEEAEEESSEEEEESSDEDVPVAKKRAAGKKGGGRGGGGLAQQKEISDKLAAFLGKGKTMARTDIVKELWNYIREHNLQNPSNKREILLDRRMQEVFDCKMFTMFTMNKYISAHIHPFKPVDLTQSSSSTAAKKKRKSRASPGGSAAKKRKSGSQPPYRLSQELQDVVGTDILPRPQVVSKLWTYIKANNLQNEKDKREIICDEKLIKIMKKPKISMFKMNVHIGDHLLEKVDRSEYHHEDSDANNDDSGSDGSE